MADIVGHWKNLAEAQKLTQSMLLQGVVEEILEEGSLLPIIPPMQINGKSLLYNREKTWNAADGAGFFDVHEQIPWTSDVEYTAQVEVELKRVARQSPWDKFIQATYGSINDYRAIVLSEVRKRCMRFVEDRLLYGDKTARPKEFDGLHSLAGPLTGDNNIDQGEAALSLLNLRAAVDAVKPQMAGSENVAILLPGVLNRRIDQGYQEAGFVRASVTVSPMSVMVNGVEIGGRVKTFDGIPMIRSDYLVAEEANTGLTAAGRAKNTTGTKQYSIFVIRFALPMDKGFFLAFGGTGVGQGEFRPFEHTSFEKLEDFDAGGERLVSYLAPGIGATWSIARITDITDAAVLP